MQLSGKRAVVTGGYSNLGVETTRALFAVALQERRGVEGPFAVHPRGIQTPLQRHLDVAEMQALGWVDADGNLSEQAKASAARRWELSVAMLASS